MNSRLGRILMKRRNALGISVDELAERSRVSADCINSLESEACENHMDEIGRIAKELRLGLYIAELDK